MALGLVAAPAAAGAAPVSSHAMLHACCAPDGLADRIFSESKAMGAAYVRVDLQLRDVFEAVGGGPRPMPDWSTVDRVSDLSRRHGVPVLGLLLAPPAYLTTCPERWPNSQLCPAADPAEFGRLAGEIAYHARDTIAHWEIVNEPDGSWAFEGSAEQYARMLSAAHDAIKARVPAATVVMGGIQSPHETGWLDRMLATPGADAIHKFDVANVHLRGTAGAVVGRYREVRARLASRGFIGPLWVTEHGYPADPAFQIDAAYRSGDASQAAYLTQSLVDLGEAGAAQVFVTLRDNLGGQYASEGVEHIDETPGYAARRRPAFAAVRRVVDAWDQLMAWRSEQRRFEALEKGHLEQLSIARTKAKLAGRQFRDARRYLHRLQPQGRGAEGRPLVADARAALSWYRAYAAMQRRQAALAAMAAGEMRRRIAGG